MKFAHLSDCHLGGWRQPELKELNIGHFLVGEAIFTSLTDSIRAMRAAMDRGFARRPAL